MNCTSNYRHAAVVLKSLTTATANRFLAKLDPALSQQIIMEMRRTRVTAINLREAIEKLKSEGIGTGIGTGGLNPIRDHATAPAQHREMGEKILRVDDVQSEQSFGLRAGLQSRPKLNFSSAQTMRFEKNPFGFLTRYDGTLLDRLFSDLNVRSAAVILSTLTFEFASTRMQAMEDERKVAVMHAIADLEELHPAEVIDLKFAVRVQIQQMIKRDPQLKPTEQSTTQSDPAGSTGIDEMASQPVSESVNASVRESVNASVDHSSVNNASDRPLALIQQGKLIASLLEMPDEKVKQLLNTIDTTHLAPALKSCPVALQNKVLKNMAKKPAAVVSRQMLDVRVDQKHRISSSRQNIAAAIEKMQQD